MMALFIVPLFAVVPGTSCIFHSCFLLIHAVFLGVPTKRALSCYQPSVTILLTKQAARTAASDSPTGLQLIHGKRNMTS